MSCAPKVLETFDFSGVTQKVIALSAARSGSWAQLCRDIPISPNHLYRIKMGKARVGVDIFLALLDHIEVLDPVEDMLDEKFELMGLKTENCKEN